MKNYEKNPLLAFQDHAHIFRCEDVIIQITAAGGQGREGGRDRKSSCSTPFLSRPKQHVHDKYSVLLP